MEMGYVGLGNMGGAIALRLLDSHAVTVYDADASAVHRLVQAGAARADSLIDLGSRCDVILLCLPMSAHVETVLFSPGGLASAVKPGTLIIDQTTGDPTATRSMAVRLADQGVDLVDAAVSGGVSGAAAGTLAIMVGAGAQQYPRAESVLTAISPNIFHAGDVGAGQAIKLVNNLISGTQRLLTLEGLAMAVKNGIDPATAVRILMAGGARNRYMEQVLEPRVLQGNLEVNFTMALAHKDIRLACQLAMASEVPMFYGNLTRELLQTYMTEVGRDAQVESAALVVDRLAGTRIVPVPSAVAHGSQG